MNDETMIEIDQVRRLFKGEPAIDEISVSVRQGELFGVLGPDGAGKSTLLRMMATVLNPSSGKITVQELDSVEDAERIKAMMGYMPQQFGLYSDLTVAENLDFVAGVFGVEGQERETRLTQLYDFTQLAPFKERRAGLLSGGMKKKLGLACALIHRPPLLLLDEPTTGVDPVARRGFWDLLSGLHADGTTTVVSTPYMDEAERCNRVALLYQGCLLACDTPQAVKARVPGNVIAIHNDDMHTLRQSLEEVSFVLQVQTYGDQLNVIVSDEADEAQRNLRAHLEGQGIHIDRLEAASIRMEEAFIYLISEVGA